MLSPRMHETNRSTSSIFARLFRETHCVFVKHLMISQQLLPNTVTLHCAVAMIC